MNKHPDTRTSAIIAIVRGAAFALITGIYIQIPGPIHSYLWCVYIGFFLTMALGVPKQKYFHCIASLMCGYFWGFLYLNAAGWMSIFSPFSVTVNTVAAEFLLTSALLFIHLRFLSNTPFHIIPAIFAGVASLFAAGGWESAPFCALSIVIGISMAYLTDLIIRYLCRK